MREFKQIHSHMIRTGLIDRPSDRYRMVAFCCSPTVGDMNYARLLFDDIPDPDPFLWNTMIKGHASSGSSDSALSVYLDMLASDTRPDGYTLPFLLRAFTSREAASAFVRAIHSHAVRFGFGSNAFVVNALIHTYSLCGRIDDARVLFDKSANRDAVTWNALMSGYNRCKRFAESLGLFVEMEREGIAPTSVTLVSVLSACTGSRDLDFGRRVHQCITDHSIETNLILDNALIDMYATCGEAEAALEIFKDMKSRDVISWTAVVRGLANSGQLERAREFFDQTPERDFVLWTAMIDGYVRAGHYREALEIFQEMQAEKVRPDGFTMVSVLTACAHLGALEMGEWVRAYIEKNKIKIDVYVGNALIDMYSKCGNVESAITVFEKLSRKDKFTWTAMITGLAVNGRAEEALRLFSRMIRASVKPDEITYIGVLSACTHAGFVERGRQYFSSMIAQHGIVPSVTHYGCMVDLLGRAGHLREALEMIENMPTRPNSVVWGALLGGCRIHRDIKTAEMAAERMLELEPDNVTVYVVLSNIYSICGRLEDVKRVRKLMEEKRMSKTPGCSLIEMNGVVHEFVAGDRFHPRSGEIYQKLSEMGRRIRVAGYVPDVSEVTLDLGEEEREDSVGRHSEKLAVAFGLISSGEGTAIRIVKNLRMCGDCHNAIKFVSEVYQREVVVRDRTRFHHFKEGACSCKDYW
ncbi:putative pentatricopeptide repeat-containing protein [Acorus calamus]|uniref:Pentatricopeptide repeat-containing protein n=1 Tax=Acorus calamus TaxID=4465 RepID=A0AAV9C1K3_ACOCL|nr:putative pentatricopeptide repeat-containing protein [Acorus calamus]